jgi:hypothetical protein
MKLRILMSMFLCFLTHEEQDTASHININDTTGKWKNGWREKRICTMLYYEGGSEITWFQLGILELRGLRRGVEKQHVPYVERKRMTFIGF